MFFFSTKCNRWRNTNLQNRSWLQHGFRVVQQNTHDKGSVQKMSLGYVPPPPILDYVLKNLRFGRLPNWRNREFVLFTLFCSQSIAWALRSHHWFHSIAPVNIHWRTKNHWNHYHHLHYPHNRFPEDLLNIAKGTTDPGVDCFDQ